MIGLWLKRMNTCIVELGEYAFINSLSLYTPRICRIRNAFDTLIIYSDIFSILTFVPYIFFLLQKGKEVMGQIYNGVEVELLRREYGILDACVRCNENLGHYRTVYVDSCNSGDQ